MAGNCGYANETSVSVKVRIFGLAELILASKKGFARWIKKLFLHFHAKSETLSSFFLSVVILI
jgi:hypothetical protein